MIPSETKGSRFEIVTPVCHEKALRCAGNVAWAYRNYHVKRWLGEVR